MSQVLSTEQIAKRLVELCSTNQFEQAHNELFADNAVSIEAGSRMAPRVEGRENISNKVNGFMGFIKDFRKGWVSEPLVTDKHITFKLGMDASFQDGSEMNMEELIVYEVNDGKIVKEEIFY